MPSPFPGMDPYLEGSTWMSFHSQYTAELARQLAPKVRPRYLVLTTERFVLDEPEGIAVTPGWRPPDLGVVDREGTGALDSGGTVTAAPVEIATLMPVRTPQWSIEIRDAQNRERVTAIEVLSPANKRGDGRQEYLEKRRRILLSTAHLLEIDLLRRGTRVPMRDPLPPADYYVLLSRSARRPIMEVWPIRMTEPLPRVPIPLLPGDPDSELDLQLALNSIYDLLGYDLALDCAGDPPVSVSDEQRRWIDERLREMGVRP